VTWVSAGHRGQKSLVDAAVGGRCPVGPGGDRGTLDGSARGPVRPPGWVPVRAVLRGRGGV